MLRLYRWAEQIWFKIPEKFRFLLVGGFNTVVAYGLFAILYWFLRGFYALAVVLQYILTPMKRIYFHMNYMVKVHILQIVIDAINVQV